MLSLCDMYALSSRCRRRFRLPPRENSSLISISTAVPQPSELSDMVRTEFRRERDCHMACHYNQLCVSNVPKQNRKVYHCDGGNGGLLLTCTELSMPGVIGRYPAIFEELGRTL